MNKQIRVKVSKVESENYWYSLSIGYEFVVTDWDLEDYRIDEGGDEGRLLAKADCEIVQSNRLGGSCITGEQP